MDTQSTAFRPAPAAPYESHVVSGFRNLNADVLPRLNQSLGTTVSPALFERLLSRYRDVEKRDPTVGEVRLLDAVVRLTADLPERIGAGEMTTDSDEMRTVWADAMRRRALLNGGGAAPCTLPELLGLTARWLIRTGSRPSAPAQKLFCGDDCTGAAAAARYVPTARAVMETGVDCLLASASSLPPVPPVDGDLLVLIREASAAALNELILTASPRRPVAGAAVLGPRPLPLAAADGLPGLTLNLDRLLPEGGDDMIPRLCRGEGVLSAPPCVSMLLRVRAGELKPFFDRVGQLGLRAVVIGKVESTGSLAITSAAFRVASVSLTFLSGLTAPRLCSVRLPVPAPGRGGVTRPALFGLPTPFRPARACGLCVPAAVPGKAYAAAGSVLFTAFSPLPDADTAYHTAVRTLLTAVSAAWAGGLTAARMQLAVILRGRGTRPGQSGRLPAADPILWAAGCGLYRASAELCLPVTSTDVSCGAPDADSLTVIAWGPAPAVTPDVPADALLGCAVIGQAPDWATLRARLAAPVVKSDIRRAPLTPERLVPTAILPLLRKDRTDELKHLSAALARRGIRSVIQPVAVQLVTPPAEPAVPETRTDGLPEPVSEPASEIISEAVSEPITEPITEPISAPDPVPAPAPIPIVTAAAARALLDACRDADVLVLAMPEEDGDILLREPSFADSLTVGKRTAAVGGVCRTLARLGILPGALTAAGETVPTAGQVLPTDVTDHDGAATRLVCRPEADLPVCPTDVPHLVTYHAPGVTVPDGFTAPDRDLVGFIGGLPDLFPLL